MNMANQYQKMMLVPSATKAMNIHQQMKKTVKTQLPDEEKLRQLQQLVMKYLHQFRSLRGPVRSAEPVARRDQSHYVTAADISVGGMEQGPTEQEVNDMVAAITQRPDIMDVNMRGELVYHGRDIPGSNILDLMAGIGEDQELFSAGMREVQDAEQPSEVPDFDGFSFYNNFYPQYTSTPLPSPTAVRQLPQLPSHAVSPRRRLQPSLPTPQAHATEDSFDSSDLPDPLPVKNMKRTFQNRRTAEELNAIHATDPRNTAVKTRVEAFNQRKKNDCKIKSEKSPWC